jgi:hypothetical protein
VSVFARRNLRDIVLTSQILTLPDMTGYITIPGDYPVARVSYAYQPTPTIAEGFIERDGFGISFRPKVSPGPGPGKQSGPVSSGTDAPPPINAETDLFGDDEPVRSPIKLNEMEPGTTPAAVPEAAPTIRKTAPAPPAPKVAAKKPKPASRINQPTLPVRHEPQLFDGDVAPDLVTLVSETDQVIDVRRDVPGTKVENGDDPAGQMPQPKKPGGIGNALKFGKKP